MKSNIQAFTLIELLVAMLIIGILAAVALPQYQKAVGKSRTMTAINNLKTIKDAQEVYYLAHGSYARDFSNLDITLPGESATVRGDYPNEYYYFFIDGENGTQSVKASPRGMLGILQLEWYLDHQTYHADDNPGSFLLCAGINEQGKNLCKTFQGSTLFDSNGITDYYLISL